MVLVAFQLEGFLVGRIQTIGMIDLSKTDGDMVGIIATNLYVLQFNMDLFGSRDALRAQGFPLTACQAGR